MYFVWMKYLRIFRVTIRLKQKQGRLKTQFRIIVPGQRVARMDGGFLIILLVNSPWLQSSF